jgi:hypothetical protein
MELEDITERIESGKYGDEYPDAPPVEFMADVKSMIEAILSKPITDKEMRLIFTWNWDKYSGDGLEEVLLHISNITEYLRDMDY